MFAVIAIKNNQYKVIEGQEIIVPSLKDYQEGDKFTADSVFLLSDEEGKDVKVGTPSLNVKVDCEVVAHEKGEKIRVFKMKAKKRYRRTQGHRDVQTRVRINKIGKATVAKKETAKKEEPATA